MTNHFANDVGYMKPPVRHQFKKGQSGNAKGRPKGSPNLLTALQRAMAEKVEIVENGRRKTITKLDATAKQLVNKAAGGDARSAKVLLSMVSALDAETAANATSVLPVGDRDQQVMKELVRRIRAVSTAPTAPTPEKSK